MPDREKVVKGLECCCLPGGRCNKCPYVIVEGFAECTSALAKDALDLLKEQEPVKPIPPTDESEMWRCGNCHHQIFRCTHQRFCERCGRPVKWK